MPEHENIPEHLQRAPARLREPIRNFFDHVIEASGPGVYDAAARTLLIRYCELLDQLEDVRAERAEKGITLAFKDKHGQPRIHPLAKYEMQLTNELGKLFRLLGWDQVPGDGQGMLFK